MKLIKTFLVFLFVGIHLCNAQDTTLLLKPTMLNKDSTQIYITEMKGWYFKQGNDTAWAKADIDLAGWKRMLPTELSENLADKNGKMEGWFRLKIKVDSTFGETSFGVRMSTRAASDLYINGKRIASFGNTGLNGAPYQENRFTTNFLPVSVNLKPGIEYTLTLHVVDYLSRLPPYHLKAKDTGLGRLIRITVPKYNKIVMDEATKQVNIHTIIAAVCAVLSLLFWLIFFQNRSEKNLLLFSVALICLTIGLSGEALFNNEIATYGGISYVWLRVFGQISQHFFTLYFISVPIIFARIFKRKVPLKIIYIFLFCLFFLIISGTRLIEVDEKFDQIFFFIFLLFIFIVSIYYVVSSWKTLKDAQWAIIVGLMFVISFMFLIIIFELISPSFLATFAILTITVLYLSFPISLMVYVAMRFKEIIHDVQENAKQVVQMSEEKKEQALNQQKMLQEEVTKQTAEIRTTLDNLKSTQAQLIQSEKMASLGELTAGIAHEIQNPLNFVNNFSELSVDLAGELEDEIKKPDLDRELITDLTKDLKSNQEKINLHGKRASDIVKGMLQHSRTSSGKKELTDINKLCDEYLRLAYHGLRAKDKTFNAEMVTHFDPELPKIEVIPQDIGRVILNLITNAFYAVNERANLLNLERQSGDANLTDLAYGPKVTVTTHLTANSQILISVKDNGSGIPEHIKDKIFQ
ncbi:MAG: ATP-binding protein, partial [Saprospiraceae bacterium]